MLHLVLDRPIDDRNTLVGMCAELDGYIAYLNALEGTGTESFGTGVVKVFAGITDVFGRIVNNFKTTIFKMGTSFKRSEIRYFSESHITKVKVIESMSYDQLRSIMVDIPSGMICTYTDAVKAINILYNMLDMANTLGMFNKTMEQSYCSMSRGDTKYINLIKPVESMMNNRHGSCKQVVNNLDASFTGKNTDKVKFETVYKSMEEFRNIRKDLLAMEPQLKMVHDLSIVTDNCTKTLTNIISYHEHNESSMDKTYVSSLANTVKLMAVMLDNFATNNLRQLAVEHNHILVMESAYKQYK